MDRVRVLLHHGGVLRALLLRCVMLVLLVDHRNTCSLCRVRAVTSVLHRLLLRHGHLLRVRVRVCWV